MTTSADIDELERADRAREAFTTAQTAEKKGRVFTLRAVAPSKSAPVQITFMTDLIVRIEAKDETSGKS